MAVELVGVGNVWFKIVVETRKAVVVDKNELAIEVGVTDVAEFMLDVVDVVLAF